MKRKVLVTMLCLAISVSAIACGTENTTEQLEETATEQTTETQGVETQETETQEVDTQEVETPEIESQEVETETQETEEIVQITGEIYQLGETVEIREVYMGYNMEKPKVAGDADLVIEEINNGIVSGHVSINVPDVPDTNWIFSDWIKCSFLDENFQETEDTKGYNVALSSEDYDNGAFQHGDDCEIAFRVKNQDTVMYLKLACESPEGDFDILVKLK